MEISNGNTVSEALEVLCNEQFENGVYERTSDGFVFNDLFSVVDLLGVISNNSSIMNQLEGFFLMNLNLMMGRRNVKYREILSNFIKILPKLTDNDLGVIITGNGESAASIISHPLIGAVVLPMEYGDEIDKYRINYNDEDNRKYYLSLIDKYKTHCDNEILSIRKQIKEATHDDNTEASLIECYSPNEIPWMLFWLKFRNKQYISIQILIDSKNLPFLFSQTNGHLKVPGRVTYDVSYNQNMENICRSLAKRMQRLRSCKSEMKQQVVATIFIDIVKYSEYGLSDQVTMVKFINTCLKMELYRNQINEEMVTISPSGDGLAISFIIKGIVSAEKVFDIAIDLYKSLLAEKLTLTDPDSGQTMKVDLSFRMGIHSADDFIVVDANGMLSVVGPGINMTQRVMDIGEGGHLLVSEKFFRTLSVAKRTAFFPQDSFLSIDKHNNPIEFRPCKGDNEEFEKLLRPGTLKSFPDFCSSYINKINERKSKYWDEIQKKKNGSTTYQDTKGA